MQLDDILILDCSRLLPGPYATQLLADLGATVIKIEEPERGDYARKMAPIGESGHGEIFEAVNRGKRSVSLDLTDETARKAFYELVETADVVFETFRPGVTERLGIDYDTLVEYNEELVYASLSGFGGTGPNAERAGHDLNYAGETGLLDMTRPDEDSKPVIPGYPMVDMASGLLSAFGIVSALLARERGGDGASGEDGEGDVGGTYLDLAMTDTMLSFAQVFASGAFAGRTPRPGKTMLTGEFPCYDVYRTADDRYLTVAVLEPKFWRALCETIERPELVEKHLSDDPAIREAVRETLQAVFETRTMDEWLDEFDGVDTAVGGVYTVTEAFDHEQTRARGMVVESDGSPPRIGFPIHDADVDADGSAVPTRLPDHGEHTASVLREAGVSDGTIARLTRND
ncbi:CoA transferase [Haladaptatus sp. AB618]|uniref:CaiB/BaiF CoA transferase family protein n=1 Tax=Haladaptatus sp. AB618 TaxID=2934173 RepID=UPI00209C3640|nr:CaiB/BaiF CoA-transferase family protein [Haladaptatus sp. AB618]MCO8255377.1 CoA transferase [Haladaptatus sp. AB618]